MLRLRSDEQLLALLRTGNDDAFAVIATRYEARLLAYVRQMLGGARADAEDVLQDVLLSAYRALTASERPIALKPWLYRIAHNRTIDHLRRPAPDLGEIYEVNRPAAGDPVAATERRERLHRLVAAIGELPEQQRSALLLREMEGLSYTELAATLDSTVPAVKSLLVRARMGLVEHHEAEDADCVEIRTGLLDAYRRGVRISGLARRHISGCDDCRTYHRELRDTERALAALGGSGPLSTIAKLLGFGGAGGGGAAAAAGGAGGACAAASCGLGTLAAVSVKGLAVLSAATVVGLEADADRPAPAAKRSTAHHVRTAAPGVTSLAIAREVRAATAPADTTARRRQPTRRWQRAGHRAVGFVVSPESAVTDLEVAVPTAPTATTTTATTPTATTGAATATPPATTTATVTVTTAPARTTTVPDGTATAVAAAQGGAQAVPVTATTAGPGPR